MDVWLRVPVLTPDRRWVPVPGSELLIVVVTHLVDVLRGTDGPQGFLNPRQNVPVVQLQGDSLAVAPGEDRRLTLKLGSLLLAIPTRAPGNKAVVRHTAYGRFERLQECVDRLVGGPTGQDRRA